MAVRDDGDSGNDCAVSMGRKDNDLTASTTIDTNVMTNRARGGDDDNVAAAVVTDNDIGMGDIVSVSI